jgi:hypothetical protein
MAWPLENSFSHETKSLKRIKQKLNTKTAITGSVDQITASFTVFHSGGMIRSKNPPRYGISTKKNDGNKHSDQPGEKFVLEHLESKILNPCFFLQNFLLDSIGQRFVTDLRIR